MKGEKGISSNPESTVHENVNMKSVRVTGGMSTKKALKSKSPLPWTSPEVPCAISLGRGKTAVGRRLLNESLKLATTEGMPLRNCLTLRVSDSESLGWWTQDEKRASEEPSPRSKWKEFGRWLNCADEVVARGKMDRVARSVQHLCSGI